MLKNEFNNNLNKLKNAIKLKNNSIYLKTIDCIYEF